MQDPDGGSAMSTYTVTVDDLPIGAAIGELVNIDMLTVEPSVPRAVAIADNGLTREFVRPLTDAELVVLNAVEAMGTLNGVDLDVTEALNTEFLENTQYQGSEGFSSGKGYPGTISVDPTDECGRFFIDTIHRDSMLSLTLRSTIDPTRSSGVVGYSAELANGDPLPGWISPIGDGEYLIDPSVGVDSVKLQLTAHRASGWSLDRYVVIDIATGEITELFETDDGADVPQSNTATQ